MRRKLRRSSLGKSEPPGPKRGRYRGHVLAEDGRTAWVAGRKAALAGTAGESTTLTRRQTTTSSRTDPATSSPPASQRRRRAQAVRRGGGPKTLNGLGVKASRCEPTEQRAARSYLMSRRGHAAKWFPRERFYLETSTQRSDLIMGIPKKFESRILSARGGGGRDDDRWRRGEVGRTFCWPSR